MSTVRRASAPTPERTRRSAPITTFVDDIRNRAEERPDAPAIVLPDTVVSYRDLVERIEGLAALLVARGVGPERVCAIALEPGVGAIVAMAAVIRAGGAFLSLDIDLPGRRLRSMVDSGGADFLITTGPLDTRLGLAFDGTRVLVDETSTVDVAVTFPVPCASSLAYVSHTSGSTGVPNAVLVEHRGLGSYLRFVVRDYGLGPDTAALQIAPLGYDASIRDTFAPLMAGGRLVVVPRSALLRPEEFVDVVAGYRVDTMLSVTPSFLTFLATWPDIVERLRGVRLVVASGESLRPFLTAGGRDLLTGELVNQYGPTECTMTSSRFRVPVEPETDADIVGTPIDGVTVQLLDGASRPVADGAIGEICVGGVGVARGYRARPGRTAERFVPDPSGPPGSRVYRTGDLGRRRVDGTVEYLGRSDRQIKIRGYRVDPAEVEGALLTHARITGAAVTSDVDGRGRVFLVAHVAGALEGISDATLRAYLAETLPPYLMPRRFVRVGRIPTTRSGKADRSALLAAIASNPGGTP